jgi:hypothetical protein
VRLEGEDHDVHRPEGLQVVRRGRLCVKVTAWATDRHAVRLQRRQVCASRDERDVVAAPRERRADVSADRTGADHRKPHRPAPRMRLS